ncbi:MAG: hypothetical protein HYS26_03940 [Candidatus Kaiserbacteria bacterium]|nr:MAG: hypothetical protein HYS26_03940 [Candidatus Kaiserbacteria bacterium]
MLLWAKLALAAAMCCSSASATKAQDVQTVGAFKKIIVTPRGVATIEMKYRSTADPAAALADALQAGDALLRAVEILNDRNLYTAGEKCYLLDTRQEVVCSPPLPRSRPNLLEAAATR